MNQRRNFLKMASAAALPAAALVSNNVANAQDRPTRDDTGAAQDILGTWNTVHTLPIPPGSFREFMSFAAGGVFHETNSFLHPASNLDFSMFGLPSVLNASEGVGNWVRGSDGLIAVVFRKLLFDGSRQNFADLHVTGTVHTDGSKIHGDWHITVVTPAGNLLADFGPATSDGTRLN